MAALRSRPARLDLDAVIAGLEVLERHTEALDLAALPWPRLEHLGPRRRTLVEAVAAK
ncbi:hypothetical protein WME95_28420 [Sorangium sp. So ce327]|uniref:hypothetical protein n=1 Tax=Sorangium sp. So ce327 TaxID=3133301 RepID=UPI003F5DEC9D